MLVFVSHELVPLQVINHPVVMKLLHDIQLTTSIRNPIFGLKCIPHGCALGHGVQGGRAGVPEPLGVGEARPWACARAVRVQRV